MDYFSRIGLVLEDLVANSTMNGDKKAEALRLAPELQGVSDNLVTSVNDRVRAATEAFGGQLESLELGRAKSDAVVFSGATAAVLIPAAVDDDERARLRTALGVTDVAPALSTFDHDLSGGAGGSLPNPPTEIASEMTAKQAVAWLDAHNVEHKSGLKVADLQSLVAAEQALKAADAGAGAETVSGT